jgi:hypothetical protein
MQPLSTAISDFKSIRESNLLYVDKTQYLLKIIEYPRPYFLSRPRRFGKSLLVSTLEAIFKGERELFKGLFIESSGYDFKPYPVIRLSLDEMSSVGVPEFKNDLCEELQRHAKRFGVKIQGTSPASLFKSLIDETRLKFSNTTLVALIDEYDSPILSNVTDEVKANAIRAELKTFYAILKSEGGSFRSIFITGVSRFTKTSIFSDMNNLMDITVDNDYANICGFTIDDFDSLFQGHLESLLDEFKKNGYLDKNATVSDLRDKILEWYDGYSWDGMTKVLNPWSLLNSLEKRRLTNYWFESGSPSFLVNLIKNKKFDFDCFRNDNTLTSDYNVVDVGNFEPVPLMFQTGYLTIQTGPRFSSDIYFLKFPNLEVRASLIPLLLPFKVKIKDPLLTFTHAKAMLNSLSHLDANGFIIAFESYLSNIPYNIIMKYEAYFETVFILAMALANQGVDAEGAVGDGKFDVHINVASGDDFIIELKYLHERDLPKNLPSDDESQKAMIDEEMKKLAQIALDQIEDKKYAKKFRGSGHKIYKTALVISGRSDILIVFEEAKNWKLAKQFDGSYVVVDS